MITAHRTLAVAVLAVASLTTSSTHALLAQGPANALAARIDPYVEKQRVVVMTDIANEPDDFQGSARCSSAQLPALRSPSMPQARAIPTATA